MIKFWIMFGLTVMFAGLSALLAFQYVDGWGWFLFISLLTANSCSNSYDYKPKNKNKNKVS